MCLLLSEEHISLLETIQLICCALTLYNGQRPDESAELFWPVVHNPLGRQEHQKVSWTRTMPLCLSPSEMCARFSGDILRRETGKREGDSPARHQFEWSSSESVAGFFCFIFLHQTLPGVKRLVTPLPVATQPQHPIWESCLAAFWPRLAGLERRRWLTSVSCVTHPPFGANRIAQKCPFRARGGNRKEEIHKVFWGPGSKGTHCHFCLIYEPSKSDAAGKSAHRGVGLEEDSKFTVTRCVDIRRKIEWEPF